MTKAIMRAARFDCASRRLTVQDVPVPQPGPGEVLVRIEACGICASDVHMIDGTFPPPSLEQVTPGHEAAGTIERVGAAVPRGSRVSVLFFWPGEIVASVATVSAATSRTASIRWSWDRRIMAAGLNMLSSLTPFWRVG